MAAEDTCNTELPLPKGWIRSVSKKFDKPYYYHETTKCSIWVHPSLLYEDGGKDPAKTTEIKKGKKDALAFSRSERKTNSNSSVMGFLGLGHKNVRKDHGNAVTSPGQCSKLGRRNQSLPSLMQISTGSIPVSRVRERSPIESSNLDHKVKRFGARRISTSSTPEEKQFIDTQALHNHESQKLQSLCAIDTLDSNTVASDNSFETNLPKPKLKPLAPTHTTEFNQNRKRRSSESDISNKLETRSKIMKVINKDDHNEELVPSRKLTPAMKAIIAKREALISATSTKRGESSISPASTKRELVKSAANKKVIDKSTGHVRNKVVVDKSVNKLDAVLYTPAMCAVAKKREKRETKGVKAIEEESDETTKTKGKRKAKKKSKVKPAQKDDTDKKGILSSILDKCSNFVSALRPLKPIGAKTEKTDIPCDESDKNVPHIPCDMSHRNLSHMPRGKQTVSHRSMAPIEHEESSTLFVHKQHEESSNLFAQIEQDEESSTSFAHKQREERSTSFAHKQHEESSTSFAHKQREERSTSFAHKQHEESSNLFAQIEQDEESSNLFAPTKPIDLDDVEDMEVDDPATVKITRDIRVLRDDNVFQKPAVNAADQKQDLPVYSDPLYIVLDTNVLLSNLEFVSELKDYPIPAVGSPILVIPWMVFQELDSLKDAKKRFHAKRNEDGIEENSQALSMLSRKAINFIGKCLDSDHPRLKGQSAMEAATPITGFTEENNDDSIIHCALCLKLQSIRSNVVLLSNDRNLCNKSIIFGVKAFSQKGIISGLNKLFGPAEQDEASSRKNATDGKDNLTEDKVKNNILEKKVDEASCELQCVLRDIFSKIIETEMISAYGDDLWLAIVKIKPPWTLGDIFILLEKHWIAVFGHILGRHHNKTVTSLKDIYLAAKTSIMTLDNMKSMLQLSLTILKAFPTHSSYHGKVAESIQRVNVLVKNCNNFDQIQHTESNNVEHNHLSGAGSHEKHESSYEKVRLTFDNVWNTATLFSSLVFSSLKFPSPLIQNLDPTQEIPSPEESLNCLSVMTPCVFSLVQSIHSIISILDSDADKQPSIRNLFQSICTFSNEVMKHDCAIYLDDLAEFCQDRNTKEVLIQGLSQLDRLYAMLQQCGEFCK